MAGLAPCTVVVVGGMAVDHIMVTNRLPDEGETGPAQSYDKYLGGKGANAAIAVRRSWCSRPTDYIEDDILPSTLDGLTVRMIGSIGSDCAREFQALFEANGIDATEIKEVENMPSSTSFIIIDQYTKDNRILCFPGASNDWQPSDFAAPGVLASRNEVNPDLIVAVMEMEILVVEQLIMTAGQEAIELLLHASPASTILRECYRYIRHLIVNESEAAILSGLDLEEVNDESWQSIAQDFLDRGVSNVVIMLGDVGAYYANAEVQGLLPAIRNVPVVDVTGAGDTFVGAYAVEYLRQKRCGEHWDITQAVRRGCFAAALTIGRMGAQEGIPWADEIESLMSQQN